jgi:cholesterol transport system auxiliary component
MAGPSPRARLARRSLLGLAGALPLATAGCLGLVSGPAPRRFRLGNPTQFPADLPSADWTLEVDQTVSDPGIDTTRIARLAGNGLELQYYPEAEWPSTATEMINKLLLQSFVDSGKIPRVGDRNSGMRPDFTLKTVLRDFQAEGDGAPTVKVTVTASLIHMPRRVQAGAERFQSATPAASAGIEDIVRSFDKNLDRVLADLVIWTLTTGARARSATG